MTENSSRIRTALTDPRAAFGTPAAIVRDATLTRAEKLALLTVWENDAREMAVAEEENMGGGEPSLVEEVAAARARVASDETGTAAHKQGGAAPDTAALRVRHFMRRPRTELHPDHQLAEVGARLAEQADGILPVSDGDQIVGVVTRGDLEAGRRQEGEARRPPAARDVMRTEIAYCFPDDDVATAQRMMERHRCDHLLVVEADRRLIGVLGRDDLPVPRSAATAAKDDEVATAREGASGGVSSTVQPGGLDVYADAPKVRASREP